MGIYELVADSSSSLLLCLVMLYKKHFKKIPVSSVLKEARVPLTRGKELAEEEISEMCLLYEAAASARGNRVCLLDHHMGLYVTLQNTMCKKCVRAINPQSNITKNSNIRSISCAP